MKAIVTSKRFNDVGFEIDVDFQEEDGSPITSTTMRFSGAVPDMSMQWVKDRVVVYAERIARIQTLNVEPDATIGTDLLAP